MAEIGKEYLVLAQHKYQQADGKWVNVRALLEGPKNRFYHSAEEAKDALNQYILKWNNEYAYDSEGNRIETRYSGCISVDSVTDKELDDEMRIVAWKIKARDVAPWEELEEG